MDNVNITKIALVAIASVFGLLGLIWMFQGNDFFLYREFAPRYEAVRRETFEQSKAYNQGQIQELQNMQFQYLQASTEQRDALASVILHRTADFDESRLPSDLHFFIQQLRSNRIKAKP
jgi:hypothetical protein